MYTSVFFYSFFNYVTQYFWSIPFLVLNFINLRLYISDSNQKYNILKKEIKHSSILFENDPVGFVIGYKLKKFKNKKSNVLDNLYYIIFYGICFIIQDYIFNFENYFLQYLPLVIYSLFEYIIYDIFIGYITTNQHPNGRRDIKTYILSSKRFLVENNFLINNEEIKINENDIIEKKTINYFERDGNYWRFKYVNININLDVKPRKNQETIIEQICEYEKSKMNTVCLLYGDTGLGKSTIPVLLAKKLNYSLVDTFNPIEPGDTLANLINCINPTQKKKLIIVLEEVDNMIDKIHNNVITTHKEIPIQIKNKQDWNLFFDKIDRKLHQNIIVIMTSNKSPSYFDDLDKSYLREGRISMKIQINKN